MVGRFIEEEEVGLLHKQPRQMCAHHPPTAHGLGGPVEIRFAKSKAGQDSFCFGLNLPIDFVMNAYCGVMRVAVVAVIRTGTASQLKHCLVSSWCILLWQISNRRRFLDRN